MISRSAGSRGFSRNNSAPWLRHAARDGLVGIGAERDLLDGGIFAVEQREKLDAVHDGHLDVHDGEINGMFLKNEQGLAGILREENLPLALAPVAHEPLDHLQKLEVVIHEKDLFQIGWVALDISFGA